MAANHHPSAPNPDDPTVVLRWNYDPRSVALARAELRKTLADWGLTPLEDPATLILSELLTNAQRHGRVPGREIETRFSLLPAPGPTGIRLEVHDASPHDPHVRTPSPDDCEGRGLFLVNLLATHWGITPRNGPGKLLWAECIHPLPPSTPAS
ncbi:ATP-binding protein [Streptomyces sp. NBC_00237]|uniref:ATP-binding protein n=1 Tax=Streptomyces sp. NBC_00237 TaxID=2975687 RepID=UPI00224E7C12|nr:ATP-binding protein [Streptomyces sp. NBC_00237]MCX5202938.1 ATP-binding protein [Streptomyces sp. NBC_00237]